MKKVSALLTTFIFSAVILMSCISAVAQEISSVKFDQGNDYKFGEDVLRYNVQSRKGNMYSEKIVNDDIKRLHAMGVFSDVVAETKKTADGKIEIVFKITPKPVVKEMIFKGNKKYDEKKLRELVTITVGAPLNDQALKSSAEALRKFYMEKGLKDATVSPLLEKMDGNDIRIVFSIRENLRFRIDNVKFQGNTAYKESELKEAIATRYSILSHPWLSWIFDAGLLDRDELQKDVVRLRELYWQKGYLDFKCKYELAEDPGDPEMINVTFIIDEGEPYKVRNVSLAGNKRFPAEELMPLVGSKPGDTYSLGREQSDLSNIEGKYTTLGYADFIARPVRLPDYKTHTVDLEYNIFEGPLYRIREIFISGNKYTKDYVIRRELPILPNDPVDKNMIKVSKDRLMGMGYFEKVDAVAVNANEPAKKDIDIKVEEKRFIDAKVGAGYSDTDSVAGMFELSHNNFDLFDPENYFTGGGQKLRLIGVVGISRYDAELNFTEPWLFGVPLRLDTSAYIRNISYEDWDERRIGGSLTLTKRVIDDFTSVSGGYTFEQVNVHAMSKNMSQRFQDQKGVGYVGRVHAMIERDTRDNTTDPKSGYDTSLLTALTSRVFGASSDYYRLELKGINYYSFLDDMFVWTAGGKAGTVGNLTEGGMVPLYERYFLGGGDSIRGFPYRSIGPTDENEDNYGGQSMYLFTTEVSHPIYKIVRGAVFVDVGDVAKSSFGIRTVNVGAGYGLRIKIPQVNTPIRLDLAYPVLNNQTGVKNNIRFHFNMGASFSPP